MSPTNQDTRGKKLMETVRDEVREQLAPVRKEIETLSRATTEMNGFRDEQGNVILPGKVSQLSDAVAKLAETLASNRIEDGRRHEQLMQANLASAAMATTREAAATAARESMRAEVITRLEVVESRVAFLQRAHRRWRNRMDRCWCVFVSWFEQFGEHWPKLVASASAVGAAFAMGAGFVHWLGKEGHKALVPIEAGIHEEFVRQEKARAK